MFQPTTFSKYFLTRRIAVGGMAEVFAAKLYGADGFEKDLVIKQILPQHAKDPEFIQSFIAEAKIAVSLNHANIVGIYELGRVDGTYFIAMEYVDGLDVFQAIDMARRMGETIHPGLALLIAEEVSKGLDYAHRKGGPDGLPLGLVHRDLNPRNVLVSREGEVKILDFGIAKTASKVAAMPKTRAGVVKGTTGYMSPEQAVGMDVDARTDIYQTGLLLYELLTGSALFWRPDDDETRDRMRRHDVRPPSESQPNLPEEMDQLVLRLLAKDRDKRTQTAAEMAQQIGRVRFLYYPDQDARTLGHLISSLLDHKLREESQVEHLPVSIPNTLELSEVISKAIEHTISEDIETIATRFPAKDADRQPGSAPLQVKSDQSVEETPAMGIEQPLSLAQLQAATDTANPSGPTAVPSPVPTAVPTAPAAFSSAGSMDITLEEGSPSVPELQPPAVPVWKRPPVVAAAAGTVAALMLVLLGLNASQPPKAEPIEPATGIEPSAVAEKTSEPSTEPVSPPADPSPDSDPDPTAAGAQDPSEPGEDSPDEPSRESGTGPSNRGRDLTPASSTERSRTDPSSNYAVVAFGTRSCSSRVSVNGEVITRSTPSYDHHIEPGRKRVVIEGTSCPPQERPGSLRRSIPVVVSEVTFKPNARVKVIADFRKDRLIVKSN